MSGRPANWARNVVFSGQVERPSSVPELRDIVGRGERVRALGSGHSFNRIADTTGVLVSTAGLPPEVEIDKERAVVRVAAGVRYGDLAVRLQAAGFALHNLGSLPHISVGGAVATATHGSGDANQNLAAAVTALDMVTAGGDLVRLSRGDQEFAGAVVGLGGLGIVTALDLEIVPAFDVRQYVYEGLAFGTVVDHFGEIFSSGYSVSVFTDWRSGPGNKVWQKQRIDGSVGAGSGAGGGAGAGDRTGTGGGAGAGGGDATWLGGHLAAGPRNPVPGMAAASATEQMGVPGPWHERLPHFRLAFTPSSGEELQSEYLIPRAAAGPALDAVARLEDRIAPILQISEIRTIAGDDLWLSTAYQRDTVGLHFTWIKDELAVAPVVAAIEAALEPFGARPHWGKVFSTPPETFSGLYPRWDDFGALLSRYDPAGKFRNSFMDRYFRPPA
ncbi:MAG TPA: D-arabinono-1,4-lactone oxidase [Streptosporangiaceae bacterium]